MLLTQADVVRPFKVARWDLGEAKASHYVIVAGTSLSLDGRRQGEGDQKSKTKDLRFGFGILNLFRA